MLSGLGSAAKFWEKPMIIIPSPSIRSTEWCGYSEHTKLCQPEEIVLTREIHQWGKLLYLQACKHGQLWWSHPPASGQVWAHAGTGWMSGSATALSLQAHGDTLLRASLLLVITLYHRRTRLAGPSFSSKTRHRKVPEECQGEMFLL